MTKERFHESNKIHPSVIVEGDVTLGRNNEIFPYSVLIGPLEIGNDNRIGPHAVIGTPGQDTRNPRYDCSNQKIVIGNSCTLREFVAIHKPCYQDLTRIGNGVYVMQSANINHDVILEDNVVITSMVAISGVSQILEGANIAMGASVHQHCVIGQYAIVATGAAAVKNVKPFSRFIPGKPISINLYAIKKFGFEEHLKEISEYVLKNKNPSDAGIKKIIEHYSKYKEKSTRGEYGGKVTLTP